MPKDFRSRVFKNPAVRLLKVFAKTKGSYTFETFAYEENKIRQFNIRFLPNREYYAINFVKTKETLLVEDAEVQTMTDAVKSIYHRYRKSWDGKKSIEEMSFNFITMLIENQSIEVPDEVLDKIKKEIVRIFRNPDIAKLDVKGRPYFSNPHYGKFFITDIGPVDKEDFERYNLKF